MFDWEIHLLTSKFNVRWKPSQSTWLELGIECQVKEASLNSLSRDSPVGQVLFIHPTASLQTTCLQ